MWSAVYGLFFLALVDARGFPVIDTNYGTVRGKWLSSARNLSVASYLGIPYAEPPIGELRFQSPEPWTRNWTNVRDATQDGSMCVQLDRRENIWGDEDCLYLNIFVPLIVGKRNLPVLVFIHGGGFAIGSSNSRYFAPDYLADQEIILVTVNYRLGIFGFLSTATEIVPGNAGLKDILEALKWIQSNIANFGGDPSTVTLAGHSAGAAAAHHLALSKSTEGLFNRFITHSGSAVAQWATHPPFFMRLKYLKVAEDLGCAAHQKLIDFQQYVSDYFDDYKDRRSQGYDEAVKDDEEIIRCLRLTSPSRLVNATKILHFWKYNPSCNFGPTIEIESEDPIITKHPLRTMERGEFRDIPWINGLVMDEGLLKTSELFQNRDVLEELTKNFESFATSFLEYDEFVANETEFHEALIQFYFLPNFDSDDILVHDYELTEMAGDGLITWSSYRGLNNQAKIMNSSAYFYVFAYEGTFSSTYTHGTAHQYGVAHSDELNYLFPCLNRMYADLQFHNTESDWTMINVMTEMWSNFIKHGCNVGYMKLEKIDANDMYFCNIPDPRAPNARLTPDWLPYQEDYGYMRIGSGRSPEIRMEKDFLTSRMSFWDYLMANVSRPMDKLFLETLIDDEPSDLAEEAQPSEAIIYQPCFSLTSSIILFLVLRALIYR